MPLEKKNMVLAQLEDVNVGVLISRKEHLSSALQIRYIKITV